MGERAKLIDLLTHALDRTLDAHGRSDLADKTPEQVATAQYNEEFAATRARASGGGSRRRRMATRSDS